jgi:hypothetical protein
VLGEDDLEEAVVDDEELISSILNDGVAADDAELVGLFDEIVQRVSVLGCSGLGSVTDCPDECDRWVHAVISVSVSRGLSKFREHYQSFSRAPFLRGSDLLSVLREVLDMTSTMCPCLVHEVCTCRCHSVRSVCAGRGAAGAPASAAPPCGLTGIEVGLLLPLPFTSVMKSSERVYMLSSELHKRVSACVGGSRGVEELSLVGIEVLSHSGATDLLRGCVDVDSGFETMVSAPASALRWGSVRTTDFTRDGRPLVQRRVFAKGPRLVWCGVVAEDVFDGNRRYCFSVPGSPAGKDAVETDGYFGFLVYLLERRYGSGPASFSACLSLSGPSGLSWRERVKDCIESGVAVHRRNLVAEVLKKSVKARTDRQIANQDAVLQRLSPGHALFTGFAFHGLSVASSVADGLCGSSRARAEQETCEYVCAIRTLVHMLGERSHETELNKCKRALLEISSVAGAHVERPEVGAVFAGIVKACEQLDAPVADRDALQLQKRLCCRVESFLCTPAP